MMSATSDELRRTARKRVEEKRGFLPHLLVYVLVNGALILVWALTGRGFFWPAFVLGFWGIGLVMHYWNAYLARPVTESDVDREMERLRRRSGGAGLA